MYTIPTTSQASTFKGFWFIFRDGDTIIAAHGSSWSGRERLFINNELISEQRTYRKRSIHPFIFAEDLYEVVFEVPRQIFWLELKCSLSKNGICIGRFKMGYKLGHIIVKFIFFVLGEVIILAVALFLNIPVWLFFIINVCYGCSAFFTWYVTEKFVVEEMDV